MKYIVAIALLLFVLGLSAAEIMSWSYPGVLPTGWTQTGSTGNHWFYSNTNNAGGTTCELMFNWEPEETGTIRYYTYAFDTRKVHDMTLSFKQMVDWYQGTFNLSVQVSTDLSTWNTVWSTSPIQDLAAQSVNATIPWEWGRSNTTYLAFVFTGDTYNLNYWWIDDFSLSYSNTLGTGLWSDTIYQPVGSVIIPSDQILTILPGVILSMASNSAIVVQGSLRAIGTAQQKISISTASAATLWTGIDLINVADAQRSSP
ncbi:MAG: hypothetical protein V3576_07470 [Candidatus Cloacimonadota bacterium]